MILDTGADYALALKANHPKLLAQAQAPIEAADPVAEAIDGVRWYPLSTPLSAERMLAFARTHWTNENQLHWVLDVAFEEDRVRSRKDNAPQNLALIRKLALNILRHHPAKGSIKTKIKRAGWDNTFLISTLGHMR